MALRAAGVIARALGTGGMAGGQYIDLSGTALDTTAILHLHKLKTGALIQASVSAVIELAASPDPELARAPRAYAGELGLMFQIVDDILDARDGGDARNDRRTAVTATGLSCAREITDGCLARIENCLALAACDVEDLLAIATTVWLASSD